MLTVQSTEAIRRIEAAIGYTFKDKRLLVQVFTRKTYMKIDPEAPDNEVLEFYGDMLLSYHVTTYFVDKFAHMLNDGLYFMRTVEQFTEMRSHYVRNQYLTDRIKQLLPNIDRLVRAQNPRVELPKDNQKAYADLFESLIGAVYLDSYQDDKLIRAFILRHLNIEPKAEEPAVTARSRSSVTVLPSVSLIEDAPAPIEVAATVAEAMAVSIAEPVTAPAPELPADAPNEREAQAEEVLPSSEAMAAVRPSLPEEVSPPARNTRRPRSAREREVPPTVRAEEPLPPAEEHSTEATTEEATEEAAAPLPVAAEPPILTKREELEAYCRAEGIEPPLFGEMPKNAPNARPVAACTVRFRIGKGKPVKISLNDSGKTPAEAEEKVAAKMLKKLMEQKTSDEKPTEKAADSTQAEATEVVVPAEEALETPVTETEEPLPMAEPVEATDAIAVLEPFAVLEPVAVVEPFAVLEPVAVVEPFAVVEPVAVFQLAEPFDTAEITENDKAAEAVEMTETAEEPKAEADALPVVAEEKPKRASRTRKSTEPKPKAPSKAKKTLEPKATESGEQADATVGTTVETAPAPAVEEAPKPAKPARKRTAKAPAAEASAEGENASADVPKPRKGSRAKAKKEPVDE